MTTLRWEGEIQFRELPNGETFRRVHADGRALDPTLYERAGHRAVPVMSEGGSKASPLLPLDTRVVPTSMAEAMRPVPEGRR